MTTYTNRQWDTLKAHAAQLGTSDGTLAGEDFPLPDEDTADRLLAVLDDEGVTDEEITESLPAEPLSGQFNGRSPQWLYRTLGVEADSDDDEELVRAYEDAYCGASAMVILRRVKLMADPVVRNSPHGYHRIRVVLTHTSNPYLAPHLPLAGELEVFEMNLRGHVINSKAVFRVANPDGTLSAPAEVRDIAYTYLSSSARYSQVHPSSGHDHTLHAARTYAWARQDATGDPADRDTDRADVFARKFAEKWQAYRDEKTGHMTNLRDAYDNWLRDGTIFLDRECASCGRTLTEASRAKQPAEQLAADPAARRCERCHASENPQEET